MSEQQNDIDDLIGKVLAGEATPEEKRQVEAWSNEHVDHQKHFDQLKAIFDRAASNLSQSEFDADAAWKKMKMRIREERQGAATIKLWPLLRIAAGIVIVLSVGFYGYRYLAQPVQTVQLSASATVARDTLPDGSRAILNKGTSITYEYNPRKKERRVKLAGESFFDVTHEPEQSFIIEAEDVLIQDIGTTFNVKAWPEKDTVEVFVETGEVRIYTLLDSGINLTAGQTGVYSRSTKLFSKFEQSDTNVLAYQTGELHFVNTELKSVITRINEVYDARIRLENPALESCRLTVSFYHDTLDTIIDVIAETMRLSVVRKDKEILLNGKGCN